LADHEIEKLFKRLAGRTDVEDALSRLDTLTKEESLAVLSRNLEVTQHVDSVVRDVDGNVKATKTLIVDLGDNVKAIEKVTSGVDHNVKETKHGTQHSSSIFIQNTDPFLCLKSDTRELMRLSLLGTTVDGQC